jgi:putative ABC transport system ATP-binding protein
VYSVRGLTKIYHTSGGEIHALRGIDLDLFAGELTVLLGPSGSGKSTLLSVLGGLDRPTAGEIAFRDRALTSLDDRALTDYRRRHIGFVFQLFNLIPSLTVRENVALVTEMARQPLSAENALNLVGLAERMDHFPAQLSGGEQQRVAIARAIVKRPDVLLCDEPTGAVDSKTGALVLDAIERCTREFGTLTVLVTHNTVIAAMADRVLSLTDGALTEARDNPHRRKARELSW